MISCHNEAELHKLAEVGRELTLKKKNLMKHFLKLTDAHFYYRFCFVAVFDRLEC